MKLFNISNLLGDSKNWKHTRNGMHRILLIFYFYFYLFLLLLFMCFCLYFYLVVLCICFLSVETVIDTMVIPIKGSLYTIVIPTLSLNVYILIKKKSLNNIAYKMVNNCPYPIIM